MEVNAVEIKHLVPPGTTDDLPSPSQAPVDSDRRFSFGKDLLESPIDNLTRLPLPLVPCEVTQKSDWHHTYHPRTSEVFKSPGGLAVRNVRLQYIDRRTQHNIYHKAYAGPPLPNTEEEQFAAVIMSVAGYIPEFGIKFRGSEPKIARLSEDQRNYLQTGGVIRTRAEWVIRNFLKNYILQQDIAEINVKNIIIDEFVSTENMERRRVLGHELLGLITDKVSEPIDETYYQARHKGLILPYLPRNVQRFTKSRLGPIKFRDKVVKQLRSQLVTV